MKKIIMLLTAYTLCHTYCFSQGTWSSRASLPDSAMFQGIPGFSIENYGYAGLGGTYAAGNLSPDLWQFDPSTDSWTKKADFPGKARVAPACFVIGNYAYLVCGSIRNGGPCVNECWQYDATNNTWAKKANFPGPPRTYAVGFAIDSLGYVGTGANELRDFYKDFYAYHPSSNTWTKIADFGGIARSGASGFAVYEKGYVCFGQDSTIKYYGDMWEYNPALNSWIRKNNIPSGSSSPHLSASGFVICNNIYVGSGIDSAYKWSAEFWKYNTTSSLWVQETSVPGVTKVQGAAFAIGDTGYYGFGGDSTGFTDENIFDEFYAGDSCNILTGNVNIENISEIKIHPNPVDQILNLNFNGQTIGPATLSIMDITGRKVISKQLSVVSAPITIDVALLIPGMYFINLKTKDLYETQKFIKQ